LIFEQACVAIDALNKMHAIDTLLSGFIQPLQTQVPYPFLIRSASVPRHENVGILQANQDSNSRIHCSLNLNTETGRLSARRPNLQNQPALEKDQYKIRQAFTAAPGKRLIVADYGQVHLALCLFDFFHHVI
jgi:DNA polymerase-1